ncbi:uncharacterized protein TNCV_3240151 [Trichonephila clavipes]|nr:uncharacterized protein TNCV_3240151 [Trichonephila clavipes]
MKVILRASIDDAQKKKDALVSEPPPHVRLLITKKPLPNQLILKIKRKRKKLNIKKDSAEDFVFPKKTARPVSPIISEPVKVNNSFSDLESENDEEQVVPVENNETVIPKPKSPPQIHLKMKENVGTSLYLFTKNSQELQTKHQEISLN